MNSILIDADAKTREMLAFVLEGRFAMNVARCEGFPQAIEVLTGEEGVDLIVCRNDPLNQAFFKYLLSIQSTIPLVIIDSGNDEMVMPGLNIVARVNSSKVADDVSAAVKEGVDQGKIRAMEITSEYIRIKTELMVPVVPLQADIYIKLSNVKMLRIFLKDDVFSSDDLKKYLEGKKIDYFYVKKEDSDLYVQKFGALMQKTISSGALTAEEGPRITETLHEAVADLSQKLGFTPAVQGLVKDNVKAVMTSVKTNRNLKKLMAFINANPTKYITGHSVAVSHLAPGLSRGMDWASDQTLEKLIWAALLHDITLTNHNLAMIQTNEELFNKADQFSEEDRNKFLEHPNTAANLAMHFAQIPADVGSIIQQHHELPDGKGFPRGISSHRITPITALFCIAHDIVHNEYVGEGSALEYLKSREAFYGAGTFKRVFRAVIDSKSLGK